METPGLRGGARLTETRLPCPSPQLAGATLPRRTGCDRGVVRRLSHWQTHARPNSGSHQTPCLGNRDNTGMQRHGEHITGTLAAWRAGGTMKEKGEKNPKTLGMEVNENSKAETMETPAFFFLSSLKKNPICLLKFRRAWTAASLRTLGKSSTA